jgi:hypothetical protein
VPHFNPAHQHFNPNPLQVDALQRLNPRHQEEGGSYYHEMRVIGDHATLRRLGIAEGKRRGYAREDHKT